MQQGALVRRLKVHAGAVRPWGFLAKENRLVVRPEGTDLLHEWDLTTGQETRSWRGATNWSGLTFSPDARWCFTFSSDANSLLTDLKTGRELDPKIDLNEVPEASFSPDSKLFALASEYGLARIWDTVSQQQVATFRGFLLGVTSVAFSPDGSRFAAGSGGSEAVKLWDLESREELLNLAGQGSFFWSIAFSPDGRCVGSRSSLNLLHLWRAPSWEEIAAAEAAEGKQGQR